MMRLPEGVFGWQTLLESAGILLIAVVMLLVECAVRGWQDSALRRLTVAPTPSSRVDRFYLVLRLSGALHLLAFLFSFGLVVVAARRVHQALDVQLVSTWPWVAQFAVVYVVHSLVFYWGHRLMHTRWFWTLHKVHHAAEELNIVTPVRNHPVDLAVMTLLHAAPAAVLGAHPLVVLMHAGVNGLYQAWVHSELVTRSPVWDRWLMTPAAHRLHHSRCPDHFNRNFGILTVWDRLFGTYLAPTETAGQPHHLTYGVEDGDLFNGPAPLREMFANVGRWLRSLRA